jgi:hypothetical protein
VCRNLALRLLAAIEAAAILGTSALLDAQIGIATHKVTRYFNTGAYTCSDQYISNAASCFARVSATYKSLRAPKVSTLSPRLDAGASTTT